MAWDGEGAAPLALCLRDHEGAYSFVCRGGRVEIVPGIEADAETVLEIVDPESWIDYLHEFQPPLGRLDPRSPQQKWSPQSLLVQSRPRRILEASIAQPGTPTTSDHQQSLTR